MPTLVICEDNPDALRLRKKHLQAHLSYIEEHLTEILVAGPNRPAGEPEQEIHGSTFIYRTDNLELARQLFHNDPYTLNRVYKEYSFQHFLPAAGEWLGGKIW